MLIIPAYAKLNLCLEVLGRRPDGFHDIRSVAIAIDWHDLVGVTARPAATSAVRLLLGGDHGDVPGDGDNLAARAAAAVAAFAPLDVEVWLDKRLPSRAGLGGGSADAAAVVRLLSDVAGLDTGARDRLALSLGSDVPLLLAGGAQQVGGRGDRLEPLTAPAMHIAVAVAGESDTAAAYAATAREDREAGHRTARVAAALRAGRLPDGGDLGSGLEPAARRASPRLDAAIIGLRTAVAQASWHLTGSGGALFAIAGDADEAAALAARAVAAGYRARACRSITGAVPPL